MSGSPGTAIWFVIAAFVLTVPLVSFARRVGVSYPIVLVLAGLVLGFAPGLPRVQLDPDLVLFIFLPPLLFWESITAPTDNMRANARWITSLAIGLVIATTGVVAVVAHAALALKRLPEAVRLLAAVRAVLTDSIAARGTRFAALYVSAGGASGRVERSMSCTPMRFSSCDTTWLAADWVTP